MATRQKTSFLAGEGNNWFKRNPEPPESYTDHVLYRIEALNANLNNVLEIGCGTGWRLRRINQLHPHCMCYGVDPSGMAIDYGLTKSPHVVLNQGGANDIRHIYKDLTFDLIIFGFCLYLVDREDLFSVVADADRHLVDGGYIVIHDFLPEYPHKVKYHHLDGIYSYKMSYSRLWVGNPAYRLISCDPTRAGEAVVIIQKNEKDAWPEET